MKTHRILALVAAACAILLSSCASGPKGPLYSEVKQTAALVPKKDRSLVLIYWNPGRIRQLFHVYANDQPITGALSGGTFFAYDAAPGQIRLASTGMGGMSTGATVGGAALAGGLAGGPAGAVVAAPLVYALGRKKEYVRLNALPAETYYVEMYQGFSRERMRQVSKEDGERGLEKCRWVSPVQTNAPQS